MATPVLAIVESNATSTEASAQKPWVLVTHQRPDTDALCCLWAAERFIVPKGAPCTVAFIEAGDTYVANEGDDVEVLHMDVGGGNCDQHGKLLERASSFMLLAKEYGLENDPALQSILDLTIRTDNVEEIDRTSIHYVFKGLPGICREGSEISWIQVLENAYVILDIIYGQEQAREKSRLEFKKTGRMKTLRNGLRIATVWWNPSLREAAFEAGADVVMWTQKRSKGIEVGIQVGRSSNVPLIGAMRAIRAAEARARGTDVSKVDLGSLGTLECLPGWFLHDSKRLILSGSRSRRLQGDEFTKLTPEKILDAISVPLAALRG
jgi:hypothetical protein